MNSDFSRMMKLFPGFSFKKKKLSHLGNLSYSLSSTYWTYRQDISTDGFLCVDSNPFYTPHLKQECWALLFHAKGPIVEWGIVSLHFRARMIGSNRAGVHIWVNGTCSIMGLDFLVSDADTLIAFFLIPHTHCSATPLCLKSWYECTQVLKINK